MGASYVIFDYKYDKYDNNYPKNPDIFEKYVSYSLYKALLYRERPGHDVLETEEKNQFLFTKS